MLRAQNKKAATFRRKVGFLEVGGLLYFLNMTRPLVIKSSNNRLAEET